MSTIELHHQQNRNSDPTGPGVAERRVPTARAAWHANFASGSAVSATTGFTNPDATEVPPLADRSVALNLATGGTVGAYVVTGTFDGKEVTETITTVANAWVDGNQPFDTITSITGPDPGAVLQMYQGDAICSPPARALYTGDGGDCAYQLSNEDAPAEAADKQDRNLPASVDHSRRVKRIYMSTTPPSNMRLVW